MTVSLPLQNVSNAAKRRRVANPVRVPIAFFGFETESKRQFVDALLSQYTCVEVQELTSAALVIFSGDEEDMDRTYDEEVKSMKQSKTISHIIFMPSSIFKDSMDRMMARFEAISVEVGLSSSTFPRPLNLRDFLALWTMIKDCRNRYNEHGILSASTEEQALSQSQGLPLSKRNGNKPGSDGDVKHPYTVLVVEDNPINAQILTTMLKRAKVDFFLANDGKEGLELFERELPILVLLDINMPIMNGYEACKGMRQIQSPYTHRIIAVTALSTEEEKRRGWEVGMDDWLSKPTRMAPLMQDIKCE